MTTLIDAVRTTAKAGAGIPALAAASPVSAGYMNEYLAGRRPHSPALAASIAASVGATPSAILREDTDMQLALRRGAQN